VPQARRNFSSKKGGLLGNRPSAYGFPSYRPNPESVNPDEIGPFLTFSEKSLFFDPKMVKKWCFLGIFIKFHFFTKIRKITEFSDFLQKS